MALRLLADCMSGPPIRRPREPQMEACLDINFFGSVSGCFRLCTEVPFRRPSSDRTMSVMSEPQPVASECCRDDGDGGCLTA